MIEENLIKEYQQNIPHAIEIADLVMQTFIIKLNFNNITDFNSATCDCHIIIILRDFLCFRLYGSN